MNYEIVSKLVLGVWGNGGYQFFEEYEDSSSTPAPDASANFGSYLNYGFTKNVDFRLGYVRGNTILNGFVYNFHFYDSDSDRLFAEMIISL